MLLSLLLLFVVAVLLLLSLLLMLLELFFLELSNEPESASTMLLSSSNSLISAKSSSSSSPLPLAPLPDSFVDPDLTWSALISPSISSTSSSSFSGGGEERAVWGVVFFFVRFYLFPPFILLATYWNQSGNWCASRPIRLLLAFLHPRLLRSTWRASHKGLEENWKKEKQLIN